MRILAAILVLSIFSCKKEAETTVNNNQPIEIEFIKQGELQLSNQDSIIKKVEIELAETEGKRANGLMNRSQMKENRGMLFVFDKLNNTGFWMKDTRIPLDIIFIGQDSIVINTQKNAKPYDLNNYGAAAPYWYVLEVNGGSADKWGIKDGETKVSWTVDK